MIHVHGLTKRFGRKVAVANLSFDVQPGRGHRLPRSQRVGQEHHDALHARPRPRRHRRRAVRRQDVRQPADAAARGRRAARRRLRAPGSLGRNHLRWIAASNGLRKRASTRCSRPVGLTAVGGKPAAHVLARHAPAARPGRRAARRAEHDHPRRAGQRPRSRGHPLDPRRAGAPGRPGQDRARQQPPAVRDGADGQRRSSSSARAS